MGNNPIETFSNWKELVPESSAPAVTFSPSLFKPEPLSANGAHVLQSLSSSVPSPPSTPTSFSLSSLLSTTLSCGLLPAKSR